MVYPSSPRSVLRNGGGVHNNYNTDLNLPQSDTMMSTDDPGEIRTVIWGTNVNIQEAMDVFKDFILNFTFKMRIDMDNQTQEDQTDVLAADLGTFYLSNINSC